MTTSTLRAVGGSLMLAIPKAARDALGLGPGEKVALRIENGRLVVEPRPKPRFTLAGLLAEGEASAAPTDEEELWQRAQPRGREAI